MKKQWLGGLAIFTGLLLLAGPAQALTLQQMMDAVAVSDPTDHTNWRLEDDSLEFHVDANGDNILDIGESLRGVAVFTSFESGNGAVSEDLQIALGNSSITALFEAEVTGKVANPAGGFNFTFGPSGNLAGASAGTMIQIYENLAGIKPNIFGCGSIAICEGLATTGNLVHEVGIAGGIGSWTAIGAPENTMAGQLFDSTEALGLFNFFLATTSTTLVDPISGLPFVNPWTGSGFINGIQDKTAVSGFYDFVDDAQLGPAPIPEPGTLGMLGIGLLILGVASRHRRRKLAA